ncbi:MAG: hypothetical protein ACAI43_04530 [Phycisphaerae bacterium]
MNRRAKTHTPRRAAIGLAAVLAAAPAVHAAPIIAELTDAEVNLLATVGDGDSVAAASRWVGTGVDAIRIGGGGSPATLNISGVFGFQLPARPIGQQFTTASFSVNLAKDGTPTVFNADLYVLDVRATNTLISEDAFTGAFNTDPTRATGIQDNFFVAGAGGTAVGTVATSAAANTAILNHVNAMYDNDPTIAGKFIFFRISPDVDPPDTTANRYRVAQSSTVTPPTLTLEVPEPGTGLTLVATAAVGLRRSRRRR